MKIQMTAIISMKIIMLLYRSNVDIDIDDHFIPRLYIYDPRNWGIFYAKIIMKMIMILVRKINARCFLKGYS